MKAILSIEGQVFEAFPKLVQNDYGWSLDFAVRYNNDAVVNLTGATVTFKMKLVSGSALKIDGACALVTPLTGLCKYTLITTDLDTVGNYEAELQVTLPTGPQVYTVKFGKVQVIEDLD
jgi:hypothetical protein